MAMTRAELCRRLYRQYPAIHRSDIDAAVRIIVRCVAASLAVGQPVELRGFGSFSISARKAGLARNPRSGELVWVNARRTVLFRPGAPLRARLNPQRR